MILVILVVFAFLRTVRATIIPSIAVPLSLIGTFGVMYLCGYSLDNLSLMALAISTGFVVDDAIVVLENITRYLEQGMDPVQAAFRGAREIGFTVLSMSTSLVAVFIPILMMGGIVGRLFREFAIVLSIAIGVSLMVSLTTTPMMCAQLLNSLGHETHGRAYRFSQAIFDGMLSIYSRSLGWVLRHQFIVLLIAIGTACLSVSMFMAVPKGFFPQQDTGRISGSVQAAQDISFDAMRKKIRRYVEIAMADPNVDTMIGFCGGTTAMNQGRMYITLKEKRKLTVDQVIQELTNKFAEVPGATLYMQAQQDLQIGGRVSQAQYQYTLQGEDLNELNQWAPQLLQKLRSLPILTQVNTDQQDKGLAANVTIDRDTASRLGIAAADIDSVLYDAFGQRQVSTIYEPLNQYHVVMEVAPDFQQSPDTLENTYVRSSTGSYGSALCLRPLRPGQHFAGGESPGTVAGGHDFLQPCSRRFSGPGDNRHRKGRAVDQLSGHDSRQFPGHGRGLPGFGGQSTHPDPDCAFGGLYRAGDPLRKLYSSHHDPLNHSFRRCWRFVGPQINSR